MKATPEQREQIEHFFRIITEDFNNILLHPVNDDKTGIERLAICVADREERTIYMLGLWFLDNDPLAERFSYKTDKRSIISNKPHIMSELWVKMKNKIKFLFQ